MNFNKIKEFWHAHWKHILILLLIFFVAFGFRILILRYNLMFEFDSYWDARINANLIQTGHIPSIDAIGTYHNAGKGLLTHDYPHTALFWYIGYIAYKIVYLGAAYSQELWIGLMRFLPALYGALIALAMYLLFRWGFKSKKIGYIAGFVTAVMPAFIYRTMGGFYEPDSLGFLWMILGFAFLIKALQTMEFKKANIIYSAISGLLFALMGFFWKGYVMMPIFLEGFFVIYLVYLLIRKVDKKTVWRFVGLFAISFVIMGAFAFVSGIGTHGNWVEYQVNYAKGVLGIHGGANANTQVSGAGIAAKGVGEESNGKYAFHYKYGMFLPFIIFGLFALIYAFWRWKYVKITVLTFVWALLTFYFAWVKLKATYYFGLGLSAWVALTIGILIIAFKYEKISKNWKLFGTIFTVFLLMGGAASGVIFTYNHVPSIDSEAGWVPALQFMHNKLPENAKVFNWWSWGHWITYMGHKRASTDNTNFDQQANADFGTFFDTHDSNEALGIIKSYDADYVVIDYQSLLSMQTYAQYANTYGQPNKFKTNSITTMPFQCRMQKSLTSADYTCVSLFQVQNGKRASLKLGASKMLGLPNKYTTKPTDILNGRLPAVYYRMLNNSLLYIVDTTTNKSYGIKLWFNAPETKPYFTEIYNNGYVKIWKVNKEALKNVTLYMTGKTPKEVEEWNSKLWWLDQNTFDPKPPADFMSK